MTDRETGRSRGFGCVEMPDGHAAQSAMDARNGTLRADRARTRRSLLLRLQHVA